MKTQTKSNEKTNEKTNKMRKLVFVTLASLMVMTTACSKNNNNGGGNAAPPPVVVTPPVCTYQPCMNGLAGGQMLYGGNTTNGTYAQAQFQVMGTGSNGPGSISGVVQFNNYVCQIGMVLSGPFSIQMTQQGQVSMDVFTGVVNLIGPQGTIPAAIKIVPTRSQNTGLFSLGLMSCGSEMDLNF